MTNLCENTERFELINGTVYTIAPGKDYLHSDVNLNIFSQILNKISNPKCRVYIGNVNLYADINNAITNKEHAIPDIMVLCDRENSYKSRYYGVPELVVETLSSSSTNIDRIIKMEWYARKGIEEYWIIDYRVKSVEIYYLKEGSYINEDTLILIEDKDNENNNVESMISLKTIPYITISLSEIFNNIEDDYRKLSC